MSTDQMRPESHFAFGKNWAEYSNLIDERRVAAAESNLARLLGNRDLSGKRVLDIGSGSGLHSLAALRLGARSVVAIDIDSDSVATTKKTLSQFALSASWSVREASVFDLDPTDLGEFDVVYSWGVLHHTGDLDRAISCAAALVTHRGVLAMALYRRVWMDWFWKFEKKWYAFASPTAQSWARRMYIAAFLLSRLASGVSPHRYLKTYLRKRGMSFEHDVHDWLGGWPYESISADEVCARMTSMGFGSLGVSVASMGLIRGASRRIGLFGSGCDEYLFERVS